VTLSNYIIRKRTLDDIYVMRDESLRKPENVKEWQAMLAVLREESMRLERKKRLELSPRQFKQWYSGFMIYRQAINDRRQEAKILIKENNIKTSKLKNQKEQSMMFRAITDAIEILKQNDPLNAQARLENCLDEIKDLSQKLLT